MSPAELLTTLVARGVEFQAYGDKLRFRPADRLTAEEIEALRQNKPALLKLLRSNSSPAAGRLKIEEPSDKCPEPVKTPLSRLCSPPINAIQPNRLRRCITQCDRCGAASYTDVPIHNGRSTRRDCSRCSRFLGWGKWYDQLFSSSN